MEAAAPAPSAVTNDESETHSTSYGYGGERKIPDHPPFQARLRNLVYSLTKEDIKDWFIEVGEINEDLIIKSEILLDRNGRSSGVAIVEFKDRETLVKALGFNGTSVLDRQMQVMPNLPSVPRSSFGYGRDRFADRREDRREDRFSNRRGDDHYSDRRGEDRGYERRDRYSDRRDDRNRGFERRERDDYRGHGGSRSGYDRRDDRDRERQEPPRLQLQPRSAAPTSDSSASSSKSDPFGGAKPVDTAKVEQVKFSAYNDRVKEVEKKPADKPETEKAPASGPKPAAAASHEKQQQKDSTGPSSSAAIGEASSSSSSSSDHHQKSPVRGGDSFSSRGGARGRGDKRGGRGAGRGAVGSTDRSWRDDPRPKAGRGEQKTRAPKPTTSAKPLQTSTANKFASLDVED